MPAWMQKVGGASIELLSRSQRISSKKLREFSHWAPSTHSVREAWPALLAAARVQ
jgi:hypothetical protein